MFFQNKYIKYKKKYLQLIGGTLNLMETDTSLMVDDIKKKLIDEIDSKHKILEAIIASGSDDITLHENKNDKASSESNGLYKTEHSYYFTININDKKYFIKRFSELFYKLLSSYSKSDDDILDIFKDLSNIINPKFIGYYIINGFYYYIIEKYDSDLIDYLNNIRDLVNKVDLLTKLGDNIKILLGLLVERFGYFCFDIKFDDIVVNFDKDTYEISDMKLIDNDPITCKKDYDNIQYTTEDIILFNMYVLSLFYPDLFTFSPEEKILINKILLKLYNDYNINRNIDDNKFKCFEYTINIFKRTNNLMSIIQNIIVENHIKIEEFKTSQLSKDLVDSSDEDVKYRLLSYSDTVIEQFKKDTSIIINNNSFIFSILIGDNSFIVKRLADHYYSRPTEEKENYISNMKESLKKLSDSKISPLYVNFYEFESYHYFIFEKYDKDLIDYFKLLKSNYIENFNDAYEKNRKILEIKIDDLLNKLLNLKYYCFDIKIEDIVVNYNKENFEIVDVKLIDNDLDTCIDCSNSTDPSIDKNEFILLIKYLLFVQTNQDFFKPNLPLFNEDIVSFDFEKTKIEMQNKWKKYSEKFRDQSRYYQNVMRDFSTYDIYELNTIKITSSYDSYDSYDSD